ncbi:hypothetical protein ANCDUO_12791, partial [Ancylostoma duodenale]
CSICDTRQGACIKCSVSSCKTSFHVTCALRSGLEMRIEQDADDDKVHMISLCPRHRAAKIFEGDEGKYDHGQIAEPEALQLELPDFLEISASEAQPVVKRGRGRPRKNVAATEDADAPPRPPKSYSAKKITKTVRSWVRLCNSVHKASFPTLGAFDPSS